jgi:hypothetical protein
MVHWCRSKSTVLSGFNFRILALPLRRAVWRAFRMSLTVDAKRPLILTANGQWSGARLASAPTVFIHYAAGVRQPLTVADSTAQQCRDNPAWIITRIRNSAVSETRGASTAVVLPDVLVPHGAQAERREVYSAALLFSGDIKRTPVAIGNSTKRGHKKGLFAM